MTEPSVLWIVVVCDGAVDRDSFDVHQIIPILLTLPSLLCSLSLLSLSLSSPSLLSFTSFFITFFSFFALFHFFLYHFLLLLFSFSLTENSSRFLSHKKDFFTLFLITFITVFISSFLPSLPFRLSLSLSLTLIFPPLSPSSLHLFLSGILSIFHNSSSHSSKILHVFFLISL